MASEDPKVLPDASIGPGFGTPEFVRKQASRDYNLSEKPSGAT